MRRTAVSVCFALTVVGLITVPAGRADCLDLTTLGASGTINNAIFMQGDLSTSTGTGVIDSFVRVENAGVEHGYNTDGQREFDTKGGGFTHSLQLKDVPTVSVLGVLYREFMLDINETGGDPSFISLDKLKIHIESVGDLTGYDANFSTPVYDLDHGADNWIRLDYDLASGSGSGDMFAFIPSSLFGSDGNKFVYLYSMFGVKELAEDGFEEWAVGEGGLPITPEPASLSVLAAGTCVLLLRRSRRPVG